MELISVTETPEIEVPVHLPNPPGLVAQESGPETSLWASPARDDEKQVFFVRHDGKERCR